jgi:NAD(P)-dependent dehydrogenase (short-subunit alcohol dehydrogenase family)
MRLRNKVAIITGAASGIGRASAVLFTKEGAKVVAVDIREPSQDQRADEAIFIRADVTSSSGIKSMVGKAVEIYGKIDILFNNAGIFPPEANKPVTEVSEELWDRVIDVNLKGVFNTSKHVIPEMIKAGGGSIINTASVLGLVSRTDRCVYSPSKGGVVLLTKSMAMDFARYNIRVNCVCPSLIETEMVEGILEKARRDKEVWAEMMAKIPLGRPGKPEDVAYAALFLASDESKWITGSSLIVDGGYTAQ